MKTLIFSTAALTLIGTLLLGIQGAWSDDDEDSSGYRKASAGVAPVTNKLYAEECGSCHFAYPAGLLPEASWQKVMTGLADHFDDNAELDKQTETEITAYLSDNAANNSNYRRSRAIMYSLKKSDMAPPLRITEIPYFKHEHREIPGKIINLPGVGGNLSQCDSCHQNAVKGSFNEHDIVIKGYGPWDD